MKKFVKLRSKIMEIFGTQEEFSKAIGQSRVTVSQKLNGKIPFNSIEIKDWCKLLYIPEKKSGIYFTP